MNIVDSHVPIISGFTSESIPVTRMPFSVKVEAVGDGLEDDWSPGPGKDGRSGLVIRQDAVEKVYHEEVEYRGGLAQASIMKKRETKIAKMAKTIYRSSKASIERWRRASTIVKNASKEQLANPDVRLKKALEIYNRGKPMTKKKSRALARDKVLSSVSKE